VRRKKITKFNRNLAESTANYQPEKMQ
jgi:hypothetical protein